MAAKPELPLALVYDLSGWLATGNLPWQCHCRHENTTQLVQDVVRCEKCGKEYRAVPFVSLTSIRREGR